MSQRKRPTNLQDRFDSRDAGTYDQKPNLEGNAQQRTYRAAVPNLTVFQSLEVISVLLKDYQSKHLHIEDSDPFHQWFPYAWIDIQEGDEVKNLVTQEVYRVAEIITSRPELRNYVRLQGKVAPKNWEMLRLDDKKAKVVNIIPAYPDSEVKPYEFDSNGHIQDEEDSPSWTDTITYSLVREAPGSRDRQPFEGQRELTPRYRETIGTKDIVNQMIDTEIRFDFWTKSNASSELLREWFRDFSNKYRWLIKDNGLSQFHWTDSYTAPNATRWRPSIVHRSANYYFRSEYSIPENLFTIRDIKVEVLVPSNPDTPGEQLNINI